MTCVAITGATGFLGRALVARLLARGDRVVALVRPASNVGALPAHDRLDLLEHRDLADPRLVAALRSAGADAFVHLAWRGVAAGARDDAEQLDSNVGPVTSSVRLAAAAGCRYWLGTGSQAEYGPSHEVLHEGSPLEPVTAYGAAKVAAAASAHALGRELGVPTGWARVFSAYGPGDREGAVLTWAITSMLAGTPPTLGPCTHDWDLLYVEDAATALAALVDARVDGPVNVASGERRALREAVLIAADAVANGVRPSFDDGRSADVPLRADVRRIRELTGWKPAVPLEDGVQQTAEYLRESRRTSPTGARP